MALNKISINGLASVQITEQDKSPISETAISNSTVTNDIDDLSSQLLNDVTFYHAGYIDDSYPNIVLVFDKNGSLKDFCYTSFVSAKGGDTFSFTSIKAGLNLLHHIFGYDKDKQYCGWCAVQNNIDYNNYVFEIPINMGICYIRAWGNTGETGTRVILVRKNIGYETVTSVELILSFVDRSHLITDTISIYHGLMYYDGSVVESQTFYVSEPIEIPDGIEYILFDSDGPVPSYVSCYVLDDYQGFLGRSDNQEYLALLFSVLCNLKSTHLQSGTKYIAFYAGRDDIGTVSLTGKIYGTDISNTLNLLYVNDKYTEIPITNAKWGTANQTYHFTVSVNVNEWDNDSNTLTMQDSESIYQDLGMIMLPPNYSASGNPVRLMIGCHGAGGTVTATLSLTERYANYQYFCANGFAIMDMNGLPEVYAQENNIDLKNNVGSRICVQCYIKGYQYVIEHYNVFTDGVLVAGGSMGGLSSTNLVLSGAIPVLAQGLICPAFDTYNEVFLHPWSSGLPKTALCKIYDFDIVNGLYVYSEEKLKGYNPIVNGMETYNTSGQRVPSTGLFDFSTKKLNGETVIEYRNYPCPLKIWHAVDDPTVNYYVAERMVNAIRNAGGLAWLRKIPSGGHGEWNIPCNNPSGNTNYRGTELTIEGSGEEQFLFFKRYANI